MPTLSFYRQSRRDGGIRTGVDLDDETILSQFDGGSDDPALTWYVDVRFEGTRLPADAELARQWLIRQTPVVRRELLAIARDIPAGVDPNDRPLLREIALRGAITMTIACFAVRRGEAKKLAAIVTEIALHWDSWLESLPARIAT
jgi:hypothetical protein